MPRVYTAKPLREHGNVGQLDFPRCQMRHRVFMEKVTFRGIHYSEYVAEDFSVYGFNLHYPIWYKLSDASFHFDLQIHSIYNENS